MQWRESHSLGCLMKMKMKISVGLDLVSSSQCYATIAQEKNLKLRKCRFSQVIIAMMKGSRRQLCIKWQQCLMQRVSSLMTSRIIRKVIT